MAATTLECDIAVIGGGFGGVAAALSAVEGGWHVVLTEPTDWIGGQVTSQLAAPLDEHYHMERFGGTRSYYRFREGVRAAYRQAYPAVARAPRLNPGNGWASGLCYEPRVALQVLEDLLREHVQAGRLRILRRHTPTEAIMRGGRIQRVVLSGPEGARLELAAQIFLDATELGDLLPLTGAEYVCGAESIDETGEPHASPDGPHPERVQSFTWCLLAEHRPGENHTIRRPYGYEYYRQHQPFSLVQRSNDGVRRYRMFDGEQPFWTSLRVFDAGQLLPGSFADGAQAARDIALVRWPAADYYKESPIDRTPAQQARVLREARRLALSFFYWLQTEAPHDTDAGHGYPGLRLLPEAAGTPDGLAKAPYIRESRRVLGFKRVLEQDIIAVTGLETGAPRVARAAHFTDTVGIGWYPLEMHRCAGDRPGAVEEQNGLDPSLPFQIPLGAMISPTVSNLVAAAKNLSTTHITNSAYRVQPVEWAIGEAAGALAAHSLDRRQSLRLVLESPTHLRAFQRTLLERGMPLLWTLDLGPGNAAPSDPGFIAVQSVLLAAAAGQPDLMPAPSLRHARLEILPDDLLSRSEATWLLERLPRAQNNPWLSTLLTGWTNAPLGPFTGKDWSAACKALDLPAPEDGEYPTLRRVCERLKDFV